MMANMGLVLALAAVTLATRLAGFALARAGDDGRALPPAIDRFLGYVPIAAFAALIVPDVAGGAGTLGARLVGVAAAALAVRRTERLWVGLLLGMAAFWAAQLLLPGGL